MGENRGTRMTVQIHDTPRGGKLAAKSWEASETRVTKHKKGIEIKRVSP